MISKNIKFRELNNCLKQFGFTLKVENYYFKTIKIYHRKMSYPFSILLFIFDDFICYDSKNILKRLRKIYESELERIPHLKKIKDFDSAISEYKKIIRQNKIRMLDE